MNSAHISHSLICNCENSSSMTPYESMYKLMFRYDTVQSQSRVSSQYFGILFLGY